MKMGWLFLRMLLWLLIILPASACGPALPEPILGLPSATILYTPTIRPPIRRTTTGTRTFTPTRTATITKTADPKEAFISKWKDTCSQVESLPLSPGMEKYPPRSLSVMIKYEGFTEWIPYDHLLDPFFNAPDVDDVRLLVCIKESSRYAFTYQGGSGNVQGRILVWNVWVVDPDQKRVSDIMTIEGSEPPSSKTVSTSTTWVPGRKPINLLQRYLFQKLIAVPPLTVHLSGQISTLAISQGGDHLLLLEKNNTRLYNGKVEFVEINLADLTSSPVHVADNKWEPFWSGSYSMAYTLDSAGVVISDDFRKEFVYLKFEENRSQLRLVGKKKCSGMNCAPGPILPGNIIRRGDCEWRLNQDMTCHTRFTLPMKVLGSSDDGAWLALSPQLALTPTPTTMRSVTPVPNGTLPSTPGTGITTRKNTPANATSTPFTRTNILQLYNMKTGMLKQQIELKNTFNLDVPPEMQFSPDGSLLIFKDLSNFEIWNTGNARSIKLLEGYVSVYFSPDGAEIAAARSETIEVLDCQIFSVQNILQPGIGPIHLIQFLPDGSQLAVTSGPILRLVSLPSH